MHISYRSRMFISGMFDLINLLQQNVLEDCLVWMTNIGINTCTCSTNNTLVGTYFTRDYKV